VDFNGFPLSKRSPKVANNSSRKNKGVIIMFLQNKKEVISFRDFMSRPAATIQKKIPHKNYMFSFMPAFGLKDLFPFQDLDFTLFFIGSCAVLAIALSEKLFAHSGYTEFSEGLSSFLKVILPIVGYGSILWFFSTL
jgi:hypothetical protein